MKKKIIALIGLALTGMLGAASANADPLAVVWCGEQAFETDECLSGFDSNSYNKLVISGNGNYKNNTSSTTFAMDLLLDSVWTSIWTFTTTDNTKRDIADIQPFFGFGQGVVSGIRLIATATPSQTNPDDYKSFNTGPTDTVFTFSCADCPTGGDDTTADDTTGDDDTITVPEPGTLALLGLGLAGLGFSRRKTTKAS